MSTLPAPRNVAPLIRFSRWTLLITGILYGHFHFNHLSRKEAKLQAKYEPIRQMRDARLAKEKEERDRAELAALAKEAGLENV